MSEYRPTLDFSAAPVLSEAFLCGAFVTVVWGPVGSGKSTLCCGKLMSNAMQQPIDSDGYRRSRYAIIRNTAPMLKSTTIKTWTERFPERHCGPVVYSAPITHRVKVQPRDQTPGLDAEFIFLALDVADDVDKLRSLDLTGAWVNEGSEVPLAVPQMLMRRVGRFPPRQGDVEAFEPFVIIDSNATDEDNELRRLEMEGPANWRFFHQPPAVLEVELQSGTWRSIEPQQPQEQFKPEQVVKAGGKHWAVNPRAENLRNLRRGYYEQQLGGSKIEQIHRDLQVKFVYVQDGRPVVPEFALPVHVVDDIPLLDGVPLELGGDIGGGTLNPAAVIGQRHPAGTWLIHDELVCSDVALKEYAIALRAKLAEAHLQRGSVQIGRFWGDPAGQKRDELFKTVIFDHLRAGGFNAFPAPTNDPETRVQAVRNPFTRMINGKPGILIHRRCRVLIQALAGKWKYRRLQISGTDRFSDKPEKSHPYSDVGDSLGYLLLGGGEDREMRGRTQRGPAFGKTVVARCDFDIFST